MNFWWWAIPEICLYLFFLFYPNHENYMHTEYSCFRVLSGCCRTWPLSSGITGFCLATTFSAAWWMKATSSSDWAEVDARDWTSTCCQWDVRPHPNTSSFNTRPRYSVCLPVCLSVCLSQVELHVNPAGNCPSVSAVSNHWTPSKLACVCWCLWASTFTVCISMPNMVRHVICRHNYIVELSLIHIWRCRRRG